ncbi:hypothetical protein [Streptomyces sp. NPDC046939]|uniref:hypothetical protein n=1 Tax=Streptomyces sp. NPDC046939 TaxID=3155376 RepID=UPI0034117715
MKSARPSRFALLAPLTLAGSAHAGAVCVANKDAAIHARSDPSSATVGSAHRGQSVNVGTSPDPRMWQLSSDAGQLHGHLRKADVDC